MTWLNVFIPNLRSAEFSNSEPYARATWLSVLAYCCEQENGGVIIDAEKWSDRAWLQNCGCTASEVRESVPLVAFEGGNAVVWNYPADKEKEVQLKRKAGKRGGLAKAANKSASSCATSLDSGVLQAQPVALLLRKGIGKEGEVEMEGKGKEKEMKPKPDNRPTTENAKRIADIFHRRHSTAWSEREIEAFKKLGTIEGEDLTLLEKYYASGAEFLRHDLGTFLNNFVGEIDRARKMFPPQKQKPAEKRETPEEKHHRTHYTERVAAGLPPL